MQTDLENLVHTVQRNCHIADAHFAGEDSLCVYLLKMRELFRWERGYAFGAPLGDDELGNWLSERERLWEELAEEDFQPLPLGEGGLDPFATDAVNELLIPEGLVYGGGLGKGGRPHFFLGHLEERESQEGFTALISARELARDLNAPAAMTAGGTIFLRRESLRRVIWEKLENWRWSRPDNAIGRAIACYDFEADPEAALEAMTSVELANVRRHEVGEVLAGQELGAAWEDMLAELPRSRAELMLRAVRDNLADCLAVLPALLADPHPPSIHFYFGNLTPLRRQLFPRAVKAYEAWRSGEGTASLAAATEAGREHWRRVARDALADFAELGANGAQELAARVEARAL